MSIEIPKKEDVQYVKVIRYLQIPKSRCAGNKDQMFNYIKKKLRECGCVVVETGDIMLIKKKFRKVKE